MSAVTNFFEEICQDFSKNLGPRRSALQYLDPVAFDDRIGQELFAHRFHSGFRCRTIGLGQIQLDHLALPHAIHPTKAQGAQRMTHRLKAGAGRAAYALRKQRVEPVFGIIKSVMGFRQFLTRGLDNVQGEWTLVCLAWNVKRMAVLRLK
jgi:hypothetical protein